MNKIKNWFDDQNKATRNIFIFSLFLNLIILLSISSNLFYIVFAKGLAVFLARTLGEFIGTSGPLFIISLVGGAVLYVFFHGIARKYNKYFDYFSIVLCITSAFLTWFILFKK